MTTPVVRTPLALLPTPLVATPRLAEALGLESELLVKRDDLTGFAVAGNKARQLEMLVAEACDMGADVFVTGGSLASNFVSAATAAALQTGLRCVLVIAGPPVPVRSHPNLAAATAWGAQVRWTGDPDRRSVDVELPVVAAELAGRGFVPYVAPRGGANVTGSIGYRLAVDELLTQLAGQTLAQPPTVVVPTGSGGTLAGVVAGIVAHGRPGRVVGASVSRPAAEVAGLVLELSRKVAARLGEEPPDVADVHVVDARGPGHGLASAEGTAAAALALRHAGLVLDPVYTAKALAALPAQVGDGPAVFWHTGGLLDAVAGLLEDTP
ncbi:MAG TPA: pyridoxal-phosphate dependent enzyme [Actinomycetes bacterium]|nr:pyridoxal-phosphate dependent enzyme [Actinomycetes bacterium]